MNLGSLGINKITTKEAITLVSVIVPMHNAEAFISATLASILQERDISMEVVVVNDGSTDASLERVREIDDGRLQVIDGPCQGVAAAMNAGLNAACGEIIMRCDADDLYPRQRIPWQVDWLTKHPEFGAVCSGFSTINKRGHLIAQLCCEKDAEEITEELRNGITRTSFCTFAVRAELLRTVGGFRQYFHTAEDIDLQLRLGEVDRIWYVPSIQYYYRLHDNSLTHTQTNLEREFFESLARDFQRQRLIQGSDDLQRGCPPAPPQGSTKVMKSAKHIQGLLISRAWQEHQAGHKLRAIVIGLRSVVVQPHNLAGWRSLLALIFKHAGTE